MLHPKQFGEQLRMFMTADEIKDYATPVDIDRYGGDTREESEGMLWRHKRQTADASGFTQQIGREGVKRPVEIMAVAHPFYFRIVRTTASLNRN